MYQRRRQNAAPAQGHFLQPRRTSAPRNNTATRHAYPIQIVLALCLGSLTYGYTFSIVSTTLGQPSWFEYFDLTQDTTAPRYDYTNSIIGAMNGCFSVGGLFGAIFNGWACDYLGRRKTLLVATPIAILGGALQGGAAHIAMFLVGRVLGGFAVGKKTSIDQSLASASHDPQQAFWWSWCRYFNPRSLRRRREASWSLNMVSYPLHQGE